MAVNKTKLEAEALKYRSAGKHDKALKLYKEIEADFPKDEGVLTKIADCYQALKDDAKAVEYNVKVGDLFNERGFHSKAVAALKRAATIDGERIDIKEKLAANFAAQRLLIDAINQYQQIVQYYDQKNRPKDAIQTLHKVVELDPENVASRIKLAEYCVAQDLPDDALSEFRKAAELLKTSNRTDDYIRVLDRMTAIQPDNADLHRELAQIFAERKDPRRALQHIQIVYRAQPKDIPTLTLLGQLFLDLDQPPKTLSVYHELARIYGEQDDSANQKRIYRKILEIKPDDDVARQALGMGGKIGSSSTPEAPKVSAPAESPRPASRVARPVVEAPRDKRPQTVKASSDALGRMFTETDVYIKYGLIDKAFGHLSKILELDAKNVDALTRLLTIQVKAADDAGRASTLAQLVAVMFEKGKLAEARSYLKDLEGVDPQYADLPVLRQMVQAAVPGPPPAMPGPAPEPAPAEHEGHDDGLEVEIHADDAHDGEGVHIDVEAGDEGEEVSIDMSGTTGAQEHPKPPLGAPDRRAQEEAVARLIASKSSMPAVEVAPPPADLEHDVEFEHGDFGEAENPEGAASEVSEADSSPEFATSEAAEVAEAPLPGEAGPALQLPADASEVPVMGGAPTYDLSPYEQASEVAEFAAPEEFGGPAEMPGEIPADMPEAHPEGGYEGAMPGPGPGVPAQAGMGMGPVGAGYGGYYPAEGYPAEGYAPEGYQPEGYGAEGYPPEGYPAEGAPYDGYPANGQEGWQQGQPPPGWVYETPAAPPPAGGLMVNTLSGEIPSLGGAVAGDTAEELSECEFFMQQGLYEEARDILLNILEREPGHPAATAMLGDAEKAMVATAEPAPYEPAKDSKGLDFEVGEVNNSLDSLMSEELTGIDAPAAPSSYAEMRRSEPENLQNVFEEFKRGVAQTTNEKDSETHYDMGIAYKEMGMLNEALAEFEAAAADPKFAISALTNIGVCYRDTGRLQDAANAFDRGLQASPTPDEQKNLYYELGLTAEAAGAAPDAARYFTWVHQFDPGFREVPEKVLSYGLVLDQPLPSGLNGGGYNAGVRGGSGPGDLIPPGFFGDGKARR